MNPKVGMTDSHIVGWTIPQEQEESTPATKLTDLGSKKLLTLKETGPASAMKRNLHLNLVAAV